MEGRSVSTCCCSPAALQREKDFQLISERMKSIQEIFSV